MKPTSLIKAILIVFNKGIRNMGKNGLFWNKLRNLFQISFKTIINQQ